MDCILVSADDWQGIYINGILTEESHEITHEYLVELLKNGYASFTFMNVEGEWVYRDGSLPLLWEDFCKKELGG